MELAKAHPTKPCVGALDAFGPREVLGIVQRELRVIAAHRDAARGATRAALMRVEACTRYVRDAIDHGGQAAGRDG